MAIGDAAGLPLATLRVDLLVQSMPGLAYAVDAGGRIIACNDTFARFLGREAAAIAGSHLDDCFPAPLAARFAEQNAAVMRTRQCLMTEEAIPFGEETRHFETAKYPLVGPDGGCEAILGSSRDITELVVGREQILAHARDIQQRNEALAAEVGRREAAERELRLLNDELEAHVAERTQVAEELATELEQQLEELDHVVRAQRASEERLRRAHLAGRIGDWQLDLGTGVVTCSDVARSLLGLDQASVPLAQLLRRLAQGDGERLRAALEDTARDGAPRTLDIHVPIGTLERHVCTISMARDGEGGGPGILGTLQDVSERVVATDMLAALSARYRTIVDLLPMGVHVVNQDGTVVEGNRMAHELASGLSTGNPVGASVRVDWEVVGEDGERIDPARYPARRALDRGERIVQFPMGFRAADGRTRWFEVSVEPVQGLGAVEVFADVTERRELEAQLRAAQRLDSIGRLAGGIAHDFNNLLTVITGSTEMAQAGLAPGDPAARDLDEVRDAAARAADLTRQLLTFARLQPVSARPVDLREVVGAMERLLRRTVGEHIALEFEPGTDPAIVRADRAQLEQVLLNLVVNARDAMPDGGRIRLALWQGMTRDLPGSPEGPAVTLVVEDTGEGMPPEVLAHVFEPFYTTKEVGRGTGLGLATVYGIVQQAGGRVRVNSRVGVGTRFEVVLPAAAAAQPTPGDTPAVSAVPPATGALVLVVEDDAAVRRVAEAGLRRHGFRVVTASSGEEALLWLSTARQAPAIVVTDVVMPGMGGRSLAARMRAEYPAIPLLCISGYPRASAGEVLIDRVAFLPKPFSTEQLARRVLDVLEAGPALEAGPEEEVAREA